MVKYNLRGFAIIAATLALVVPTQAGENSTSVIPSIPPAFEISARSILSKRGDSFIDLGAHGDWGGAVVRKYANEETRRATQGWSSGIRTTVMNDTPETMWVWLEATMNKITFVIPDPDAREIRKVKIGPGESVQMSNMPIGHSGAVRGYARCNENGLNCAGDEGTQTKWEWTALTGYKEGLVWINPSIVDGYATGGVVTFGEGSPCRPLSCVISQARLEEVCPAENLLGRGSGHANCRSDCRTKNDDYSCCLGEWQWEKCQPTSQFLARECPDAYAWPEDHSTNHFDECDPHGEVLLRLTR